MNNLLYPGLLILIGIFDLVIALRFLVDKEFGEQYIRESPKAYLWRKIFGEENAYKITKSIFVPLGILLGFAVVILGVYQIIKILM